MMFRNLILPDFLEYSSDGQHTPLEFYMSVIPRAKFIDLKLGYFSTNAIRTLSLGFARFIFNGGSMRIMSNHFLSESDKSELLERPNFFSNEILIESIIENDLERLAEFLQSGEQHFYDCLKFLLKEKRLLLVPVMIKPNRMAHFKQGILSDGIDHIFFSGSCNFTFGGLVENGESLELTLSWNSELDKKRIDKKLRDLDLIFQAKDDSYVYLNPDDVIAVIQKKGQDKNLDELVRYEVEVIKSLQRDSKLSNLFKSQLEEFSEELSFLDRQPRFPFPTGPHSYQEDAYRSWVSNGYQGLFAMATGTGKTVTALNCVLNEYAKSGIYRILVVVPTKPLAFQWEDEANAFNFSNVINSCEDKNWDKSVKRILSSVRLENPANFCLITTYSQFKRTKLQSLIRQFENELNSVTIIADEAHNLGSPGARSNLPSCFKKKIGLSATPDRKYDKVGTSILTDFFNAEPPKYTYLYTMKKAIEEGTLCRFEYYPRFVSLNHEEYLEYSNYTKRLRPYIDSESKGYKENEEVRRLLILRKTVIHKAQNKLIEVERIVDQIGSANLKYAFIYVPEGYEPDYWREEESQISDGDERIINHYSRLLSDKGLTVKNFLGGTKGREEVLNRFKNGDYDVLLAMKCLDEGVNIPRTEYAIFCASTGNPRQFIQRRGRVLRTHDFKRKAKIFDLIVAPDFESYEVLDQKQIDAEKLIFRNEIHRVVNFLSLADNRLELVDGVFGQTCREYGVTDLKGLMNQELRSYED